MSLSRSLSLSLSLLSQVPQWSPTMHIPSSVSHASACVSMCVCLSFSICVCFSLSPSVCVSLSLSFRCRSGILPCISASPVSHVCLCFYVCLFLYVRVCVCVSLSFSGAAVESYPVSLNLPSRTFNHRVLLSIKPLEPGVCVYPSACASRSFSLCSMSLELPLAFNHCTICVSVSLSLSFFLSLSHAGTISIRGCHIRTFNLASQHECDFLGRGLCSFDSFLSFEHQDRIKSAAVPTLGVCVCCVCVCVLCVCVCVCCVTLWGAFAPLIHSFHLNTRTGSRTLLCRL